MRGMLTLCLLLTLGALQSPAQEIAPPDSGTPARVASQLTIQTNVDSAFVVIDSVRVGQTPLVVRDLKPGFHRLKIVHPDMTNWLTDNILDSLQIQAGEDKVLKYTFGRRYLILSVPSGAEALIKDSLIGSTPFLLAVQGTDSLPTITLKKTGYDSARVDPSDFRRGMQTIALKSVWSPDQRGEESEATAFQQKQGTFPVFLAGAVTVGFGAAAAYFKIQADDRNDQYLQGSSAASRSQIRVYDTAAAICLTFAEVGFGFLTYYLLTE